MERNNLVCKGCKKIFSYNEIAVNKFICPNCGKYFPYPAIERLKNIEDDGSFIAWNVKNNFFDTIEDDDYKEKLRKAQAKSNLTEAIVIGKMKIDGIKVAIGVMDVNFLMASMGQFVGDCITYLFNRATDEHLPVILYCCSGGARMQEGIFSLMQMEKTVLAVNHHSKKGLLYISVLTNPTMGGVTASFATIADIILAEKGAMIGFTGPRVIQQNTGEIVDHTLQTAEGKLEHGLIDNVVKRENIRSVLSKLLRLHERKPTFIKTAKNDSKYVKSWCPDKKDPVELLKAVRMYNRPSSEDYIHKIFDDFFELHGDRIGNDDHALIGGIAKIHGYPVTVIGIDRGKGGYVKAEYRQWGMPMPSGYRKALRLMKQAEKFRRPIICFVDTIGAACGKKAEEFGQAISIAQLLSQESELSVPILSILVGEGYSGGALALSIGNEVWMLENAIYSILSPEGYSSILWKTNNKAAEAAQKMGLDSRSLLKNHVVDRVFMENQPASIDNMDDICNLLENNIVGFIKKYMRKRHRSIVDDRYRRFLKL